MWLFDVNLPEDDLKKTETCRIFCELYVKMYSLIHVQFDVNR
jgi:hypothetical protein